MSNQSENAAAIDQYRKELQAMLGDIKQIDRKVLTSAVNAGLKEVKKALRSVSTRPGPEKLAARFEKAGTQRPLCPPTTVYKKDLRITSTMRRM